jgi:hypothetical protein
MLTIKNFDVLKGRSFIMPNQWGYTIIEAGEYVSPIRGERMYVLKLKPSPNYKEVSFTLYRDERKRDGGYRLYNSISGDYIIVTKKGLRDMRTFTGILIDELNGLC